MLRNKKETVKRRITTTNTSHSLPRRPKETSPSASSKLSPSNANTKSTHPSKDLLDEEQTARVCEDEHHST